MKFKFAILMLVLLASGFAFETAAQTDDGTVTTGLLAKVGHIYYVHTADGDSDHYALFRVEEIKDSESVSISWKLVGTPAETSR